MEFALEVLIKKNFFNYTRSLGKRDNSIDIYLHASGGAVEIEGGPYGRQIINTLPIPSFDQKFITKTIYEVDERIDLDFKLTSYYNQSDIAIFFDQNISIEGNNTVGIVYTNHNQGKGRWEMILDAVKITNNNYLHYAIVHELGHTLGLEHPFDDSDGDLYNNITSPWLSLYPEDTVMAYRSPRLGVWPETYTENDLLALNSLWEKEESPNNVVTQNKFFGTFSADNLAGNSGENYGPELFDGGPGDDTLKGFRGADFLLGGEGNDEIRGGNGRDTLTGGLGVDSLFGGFGLNTFEDENDSYADSLYLKSDQLAYNWIYDKAGNSPNGEKADKIGELDSLDKVYIQGATDDQLTFVEDISHTTPFGNVFSGIGIYAGGTLEAVYTGVNHRLAQLKNMFFGANA